MAASMEQDQTNLKPKTTDALWRTHPDLELVTAFVKSTRDCEFYRKEYKECTSWRGRFHQRYVYGESVECQHFDNAYKYCKMAKETGHEQALDFIVQYELSKRDFRIECAAANNVWEYRKKPPKSWEYPGVNRETVPDEESQATEQTSIQNEQLIHSTRTDSSVVDDKAIREQGQTLTEKKSSSGCVVS